MVFRVVSHPGDLGSKWMSVNCTTLNFPSLNLNWRWAKDVATTSSKNKVSNRFFFMCYYYLLLLVYDLFIVRL